MPEQWVINASPLIALAHIGHENLLFDLADKWGSFLLPSAAG